MVCRHAYKMEDVGMTNSIEVSLSLVEGSHHMCGHESIVMTLTHSTFASSCRCSMSCPASSCTYVIE